MDQRALYEQGSSGNRTKCDEPPALVERDLFVINDIRKKWKKSEAIDVAELSVGDGRMTRAILVKVPNGRLSCADISENRLNELRASIAADATLAERPTSFVRCNFDTEFDMLPSDAFDAVIALDIMEHVFDVFGFIDHCARILRSGGQLYLRVPNIAYVKHRLRLLFGQIPVTASWFGDPFELTAWRATHGWDGGHLHLFTIPILRKLVEEAGFTVSNCRDPGTKLAGLRILWPGLLFSNPLIVARKS